MNRHTFILEIILSIFYLKTLIETKDIDIFQGILFLLIYLCIKIICYIFKNQKTKTSVLALSLFFVLSVSIFTSVPLEYFFVLTGMQLFNKSIIGILLTAYYFNVDLPMQNSFLLVSTLIIFIYQVLLSYEHRHLNLQKNVERLEKTLTDLNKKMHMAEISESAIEYTTRLEERQLITQELHDELGHVLSGNTMQLEAAVMMLEHDPEKSRDMFKTVIANLRLGTESIRKILKEMQPKITAISIENIKKIAIDTEEASAIKVQIHYDHLLSDISYQHWQVILLNIKEALTNMMKYSKASKCDITFERLNYQYKVCIKDNGIGQFKVTKGMGLQGINQRTIDINGQVIIDGSQGFSVTMLLPIERTDND